MSSKYFSSRHTGALNRIGNILIPGEEVFPSFSELGCVEHVDRILESMPKPERKDLKLLLFALSFLPTPLLKFWIYTIDKLAHWPSGVGNLARLIRIGLKGLVMSLYYSGQKGSEYKGRTPVELIGYDAHVYLENEKNHFPSREDELAQRTNFGNL
jgi:hypothetical protein